MWGVAAAAAAAAKSLQSCPTLCDPIDGSLLGSSVPGILQARTLEWVAISFSNAWRWKVKVKSLSRVWLLATSWTAAYQTPPSMGLSRQEYWSGLPLRSPAGIYYIDIITWALKKRSRRWNYKNPKDKKNSMHYYWLLRWTGLWAKTCEQTLQATKYIRPIARPSS